MAKATAAARAILGDAGLRRGGLVQAHGTGTPQNRVSEAEILSRTAQAFGIDDWPVIAAKAYLGHSIGSASGDQISTTLGIWEHGILPGITTVNAIADDVRQNNLSFNLEHREIDAARQQYAIINAKGFGGNNASATLLSPGATAQMLKMRYSSQEWKKWQRANEAVRERQQAYDEGMTAGAISPVYKFDHGVLHDSDVTVSAQKVVIGGHTIVLDVDSSYGDMKLDS